MNFIFHFAELHSGSSIRYKITRFENYFQEWYKVKQISISFNCFSEYKSKKLLQSVEFSILRLTFYGKSALKS